MRFEQHRLTAESVTFRHFDSTTARQTLVEIARAQWELWARPVTLDVSVSPVINPPVVLPAPSTTVQFHLGGDR